MIISTKAKEAIKTGLAMAIAYGIALQVGFEKPMWAGFAVAFISLPTVGQSLNKAAMRMLGTLVAVVVALTIIALCIQNRWLFILFLSSWVGFCTYMNSGTKHQYFWFACGFVCVIICMDAGPDSINAFEIAVLRAEETGLGILVYSLISIFLWPSNSRAAFEAAVSKLTSTQHQVYQEYLGLMTGEGNAEKAQPLRAQEIQNQTRFSQLLDAAETESHEVRELRSEWRRYQRQATQLAETMDRWRQSFTELQSLDVQHLLPDLAAFGAELDQRFVQIERMLADQAPERHPTAIDPALDEAEVRALSHFHKAALAVTRSHLKHLETLTRSLFDRISIIKGFGQAVAVADPVPASGSGFVIDPDRLLGAVRTMAILWMAYLALIYVDSVPGGSGLLSIAGSFGMSMANMPQISVSLLFVPAAVSVLFAGLVYIFVMPQLSSFLGLGLLIFAVTFSICYLFAAPRQLLGRAFGLAMFVTITSISNEQTYSFLVVANTALMFPMFFLIVAISAYIPFSPRPDRAFLRLLGRFFRSSEYLMSTMGRDPQRAVTRLDLWRKNFHTHEVSTLPRKLEAWGRFINTKALTGTTPQQVQSLVTSLQGLTYRMQELLEERSKPQAQFLVQELLADIRAWRIRVQESFHRLSEDPAAGEREAFRTRLVEIMERLEGRIRDTLDKAAEEQLSSQDGENFYHLMGAYRGVSEAMVEYAGSAGDIDWAPWREDRFS